MATVNGIYQLFEFYRICDNLKPSIKYLASLQTDQLPITYIWENRKHLDQCTFRVGYLDFAREVISLSNDDANDSSLLPKSLRSTKMRHHNKGLVLAGYSVQRLKIFQSYLNFTIKWLRVDDQKVGSFDSEANEWNGMIGMLSRNEIDMSVIEMSITVKSVTFKTISINLP